MGAPAVYQRHHAGMVFGAVSAAKFQLASVLFLRLKERGDVIPTPVKTRYELIFVAAPIHVSRAVIRHRRWGDMVNGVRQVAPANHHHRLGEAPRCSRWGAIGNAAHREEAYAIYGGAVGRAKAIQGRERCPEAVAAPEGGVCLSPTTLQQRTGLGQRDQWHE